MKLVTHGGFQEVGQTSEQGGCREMGKKRPTELLQRVEEGEAGLTRTTGGALGFLRRLPGCRASPQDCSVGTRVLGG